MKSQVLQSILAAVGTLSLASLGAILLFITPPTVGTDSVLVPAVFSFALFLFLVSIFTFLGLAARKKFVREHNARIIASIAFREAFLLGLLLLAYLWLAQLGAFKIWVVVLLLSAVLAVEYLMLSRKRLWIR